jgi:hypothetical protein
MVLMLCAALWSGCSGSRGAGEAQEPDDQAEAAAPESDEEAVRPLDLAKVQQSLRNQGCQDPQVLQSAPLQNPEGMVLVVTTELCEGFEPLGPVAMLVAAVGNEYLQSNTLHPLPGLGGANAEQVEVLALESQLIQESGTSVILLRYRVPPTSAGGQQFIERAVVGTFDAEALALAMVQPVNFDVRLGRGRLRGEGSVTLADADNDSDLDIQIDITATGQGCSGGQCRNGAHHCQQTTAWQGRAFDENLQGDECAYIGQLEL